MAQMRLAQDVLVQPSEAALLTQNNEFFEKLRELHAANRHGRRSRNTVTQKRAPPVVGAAQLTQARSQLLDTLVREM